MNNTEDRIAAARADLLARSGDVPAALGYLNLIAWLIPGMLGVAYRRRLLAGRAALLLGAAMFAVNVALTAACSAPRRWRSATRWHGRTRSRSTPVR